ncbi:ABC transporter ATP-binding protein [Heyndrickxia ginsengihumi]|uniref:ABC transporter ATP-binding protein n=1 Tax=Heyndrickxia ginsengihumi TaxID=363870 RepID=UPI003D1ED4C1
MVAKRLFQYALHVKGIILTAVIALILSVSADVLSPLVAKNLIDHHILGIEHGWVETNHSSQAVHFQGKLYKRMTYATAEEKEGKKASILQVGKYFYFVNSDVPQEGERTVKNHVLIVSLHGKTTSYKATPLSVTDIFHFYQPEVPYMLKRFIVYLLLFIVSGVAAYGQFYYLQKAANRIIQKMRNDLFSQLQRLPISYFDHLPAGKVVARITNDTEAIHDLYVAVLSNFLTGIIYMAGIYTAMFLLDAKLALFCLVLLPILYVWMKIYRIFAQKYNHIIRSKNSELNAMLNEAIQGMSIIQVFRRQKQVYHDFEQLNDTHYKYQNKLLTLNSLSSHNLVGILRNLIFVVFIWYFGHDAIGIQTTLSIGLLYAYIDYINRLFNPINNIVNQFGNLEQALVAGERVFHLLDQEGITVSKQTIPRFQGNVTFDHVYFGYKDHQYVLKDIHFEAKQGETIALVGHSGSGKSSIMNVLFRFYDCQKGEIRIDGVNIQDIPKQTLREHMGIVLQDPYLFTGTIFTNVSLNDPRITREKIEDVLKAVGAEQILQHLEKGIDEPVIEKGSTLSAGQRQLISFARALAFNPAILILDEATSNIDTETEALIQGAMDVLKRGRTTFVIAHRLSTIKNADQIIVLDRGEIVEHGSHDSLMAQKGTYYQMYQMQHGLAFSDVS